MPTLEKRMAARRRVLAVFARDELLALAGVAPGVRFMSVSALRAYVALHWDHRKVGERVLSILDRAA